MPPLCTTVQSVLEAVNRYSVDNSFQQFVPVRDNSLAKEVSPQFQFTPAVVEFEPMSSCVMQILVQYEETTPVNFFFACQYPMSL